jgi:ubiquitin-like 1-activating enzyme E1 B
MQTVDKLSKRKEEEGGELKFDKDDEDALSFVTAASNLRSAIFGIPMQSRFDVKASAGNIIPAIATTNAIIAGMIVMEALKIVRGQPEKCSANYLLVKPSNKKVLMKTILDPPNPNCYVCGTRSISVKMNTSQLSFGDFTDKLLIGRLGFNEPNIDTGTKYFEGGTEGLDEEELEARNELLPRKLRELDIVHNALITITDQSQELRLELCVLHSEEMKEDNPFEILGKIPESAPAAPPVPSPAPAPAAPPPSGDDLMVIDSSASGKRKREADALPVPAARNGTPQAKKSKTDEDDVVIL